MDKLGCTARMITVAVISDQREKTSEQLFSVPQRCGEHVVSLR